MYQNAGNEVFETQNVLGEDHQNATSDACPQERWERDGGMTRSKGPQVGPEPGPLQRPQPTWGTRSHWVS